MYPEILNPNQTILLPLISHFDGSYGMVGGTALALQLGHRQSIDFDLFTSENLDHDGIIQQIQALHPIERIMINSKDELTLITEKTKITFYHYPFNLSYPIYYEPHIHLADPLTIGAMKAYALGRRAKWKDYVDLYHIFQNFSLKQVVDQANTIFPNLFDEKPFREQLAYHQDIDFSETVIYTEGSMVNDETIKQTLQNLSLE